LIISHLLVELILVTSITIKFIILGYTSTLYWDNGQIRIAYKGEKCDDTRNYTTNVILHCDYSPLKNDFLGVFPHSDQCEINIIMRTPVACLPLPEHVKNAKMIVTTSTNKILNFKSLQTSNHEVENGTQFYIGFPILYGHNMMCEAGTSVCFVNTSATDLARKYINMGSMTSNLKFEKSNVVLKMTSNEICENDKKFSSEIVFECDQLITGDGFPSFKGTTSCVHRFVWPTSLACVDEKPCQLSTADGQLYDFSSLHGVEYSVVNSKMPNKTVYFSICSPAKMCEGNVGSCLVQKISEYERRITFAGNFNSTLQVDESKNLFLLYENGARCNAASKKFTTKIEFIVADDENDEGSILVEDDCEIVIQFKTLLANANVKNCIAKTPEDEEIDLRALINYEGNYVAKINEKALPNETSSHNVQYLLNVCRPLNSKYSLNCHGNTAACRTVIIDEKHEEELSLGEKICNKFLILPFNLLQKNI
jgi:Cation-independent mannose-6-phosphate receptor repeat